MLFNIFAKRKPAPQPQVRVEPNFVAGLEASDPLASFDIYSRPTIQGKSSMTPVPLPTKAPNKGQALASFKTQVAKATSALSKPDRRLANTDITTYRGGSTTNGIVRDMVASSPDLAATVNAYLRVGIPETYTVIARDMDGKLNADATGKANEILRRLTFVGDPTLGYNPMTDLDSLSESLGKELLQYGAMAVELVLDKQLMPTWITPVSVTKLEWWEEEGGAYPVQVLSGKAIKLDIPTFFYLSLDQDLMTAYATSYLESAIQSVIADAQFMNDLRKAMSRSLQPRMVATLITDKVMNSFPVEVRNSPELQTEAFQNLIQGLVDQLTNLAPEDALVSSDMVEYDSIAAGGDKGNTAEALRAVQELIESKLSAGMKSVPAVLGRDSGSSSATTSTMLFMKNANILRRKLNVLYSRVLTQALRIMGMDVYVEFNYAHIDLRPEKELEAYKAMEQSRITDKLSLGFITDEEAVMELTGSLPPDGYTPLAGTMFKTASANVSANPDSQTSNMNGQKDPLKPSTPANPKS